MLTSPQQISGPVAVIGDIHGQAGQLSNLLQRIAALPDSRRRWIVLLGDLIDRGPDPRGVLDVVVHLFERHRKTAAISGNHELEMARALGWTAGDDCGRDAWLDGYGSHATFSSYGCPPGDLSALSSRMPVAHRDLIRALPWCLEHPEYFFVHAGLDPDLSYSMQLRILRGRTQTTGRIRWLSSKRLATADPPRDCRATVVSGHLLVDQVQIRNRRILVNTTDGIQGRLSALLLPERAVLTSP